MAKDTRKVFIGLLLSFGIVVTASTLAQAYREIITESPEVLIGWMKEE